MNQIGNEGAQALAALLSKCPVLKAIEYAAAVYVILAPVADVLTRQLLSVNTLHRIRENSVGNAGVAALMAALATCPSLEDLKSVPCPFAILAHCLAF